MALSEPFRHSNFSGIFSPSMFFSKSQMALILSFKSLPATSPFGAVFASWLFFLKTEQKLVLSVFAPQ